MHIVPVIDIKHGLVVRARLGDRASYAPIETPLSPSPAPLDVVAGLMRLGAFTRLYLADLDGIEGRARNDDVVAALAAAWPGLELWVDNGIADLAEAVTFADAGTARLVLGSESQSGPETLARLGNRAVLSIDFRGDTYLGPDVLRDDPALWPDDVIVMTLGRVGSGAGPDLERLADFRAKADSAGRRPVPRFWAAGGVRDFADLEALHGAGIAGALIATALHDGRIRAADLARWG